MSKNHIFDRQLLKQQQKRFSKNFFKSDFLFKEIATRVIDNIADFKRDFIEILEINARDGFLGKEIAKLKNTKKLIQTNLVTGFNCTNAIISDDEQISFQDQKFDLIINNLNLHFVNDPLDNLIKQKNLLKPDGIYFSCFFGGASLKELRDVFNRSELELNGGISPRIIPFIDVKTAGALAQKADFKNVITDSQTIEISYSSLLTLFHDLRNMALGNILFDRARKPLSKKMIFLMEKLIKELYPDELSGFIISFEVITITAF